MSEDRTAVQTPAQTPAQKHSQAHGQAHEEPLVEEELLVEEVSIDGMCGVY
jgi:mycofactocin precursor